MRQKGGYKEAVANLAIGKIKQGFNRLAGLGFVKEYKKESTRHRKLVSEYMKSVKAERSSLVISPTHSEGDKITQRIRQEMDAKGNVGF